MVCFWFPIENTYRKGEQRGGTATRRGSPQWANDEKGMVPKGKVDGRRSAEEDSTTGTVGNNQRTGGTGQVGTDGQ